MARDARRFLVLPCSMLNSSRRCWIFWRGHMSHLALTDWRDVAVNERTAETVEQDDDDVEGPTPSERSRTPSRSTFLPFWTGNRSRHLRRREAPKRSAVDLRPTTSWPRCPIRKPARLLQTEDRDARHGEPRDERKHVALPVAG